MTALDRWHAGCKSPVLLVAALEAVIRELPAHVREGQGGAVPARVDAALLG